MRLNNSAVLASLKNKLSHLSANEVSELEHLMMDNTQLFPDTPTRTSVLCHDVSDANPVKQHAYRVNPQKRRAFQQEVKYTLDARLVEPSHSAWSHSARSHNGRTANHHLRAKGERNGVQRRTEVIFGKTMM